MIQIQKTLLRFRRVRESVVYSNFDRPLFRHRQIIVAINRSDSPTKFRAKMVRMTCSAGMYAWLLCLRNGGTALRACGRGSRSLTSMEVPGFDGREVGGVDEAAKRRLDLLGRRGGDALLESGVPGEVPYRVKVGYGCFRRYWNAFRSVSQTVRPTGSR